jgi:hypothetical protein
MDQPYLFDITAPAITNCAIGQHAPLIEQVAQMFDVYVNVDYVCPLCELRVTTVSWRRSAWDKKSQRER